MALPADFKQNSQKSSYTSKNLGENPNKVRCLTDFIDGICVWGDNGPEGKRVLHHYKNGADVPTEDIGTNSFSGEPERIHQFIATVVWSYTNNQFEVYETDKSSAIEQILDCEANEEYGDSKGYDLTLKKTGEKLDTKYKVTASPPKKIDPGIVEAFSKMSIDLEAIFTGKDPFGGSKSGSKDDLPF